MATLREDEKSLAKLSKQNTILNVYFTAKKRESFLGKKMTMATLREDEKSLAKLSKQNTILNVYFFSALSKREKR